MFDGPPLAPAHLRELEELLRIPSISADPAHGDDLRRAAAWIADLVSRAGGRSEVLSWNGRPLVDALFEASVDPASAPTVLCYGHFDVQPPAPLELWASDPFAPEVRDGWLYARGVADDKGQLWALLRAAGDLARDRALPVNVRFCCDGEEEIGGSSIVEFLEAHHGRPDACVIFDTPMLDDATPVFTVATRGTLYLHVEVETGARDLHSGVYGGAALNALHVLVDALSHVTPRDGRLPAPLLVDVVPPSPGELDGWSSLPSGDELLASEGAALADERAADEFYRRTWALPSLDVNGIEGGSPVQPKTVVVASARANLSLRLAPGQTVDRLRPVVERELRRDLPAAARLDVTGVSACDPGRVDPASPAIAVAAEAFERVLGRRPLLLRSGGSLPVMPLLERLEIPAVVSGFSVPSANVHAPNERMRVAHLGLALAVARETLLGLARLR